MNAASSAERGPTSRASPPPRTSFRLPLPPGVLRPLGARFLGRASLPTAARTRVRLVMQPRMPTRTSGGAAAGTAGRRLTGRSPALGVHGVDTRGVTMQALLTQNQALRGDSNELVDQVPWLLCEKTHLLA